MILAATGQATAADLPLPPPPVYVAQPIPFCDWTGIYVGGNLGWAWNQWSYADNNANSFGTLNRPNFFGGVQIGGNYEFANRILVGLEADFDGLPNNNNTTALAGGVSVTVNNAWVTLLTGRVGYAWDDVLLYTKGGAALVGSRNPTITNVASGASITPSTSNTNNGWTLGAGLEWMLWKSLSARIEYDHVGLSSQNFAVSTAVASIPAGDTFTGSNRTIDMINVGLNYRFF